MDPDLVVYNPEGKPETLRFDSINAMLLNEFLKEHRKVEELKSAMAQQRQDFEAIAAQQQKRMDAFTAQLQQQPAHIQRVSAQLEVSKFATRRIRGGGPSPQIARARTD